MERDIATVANDLGADLDQLLSKRHKLPVWVRNGPSATLPGESAPGGEADAISAKADIGASTSALGGKADVTTTWPGSPLLAEAVEKVQEGKIFETMIQSSVLH